MRDGKFVPGTFDEKADRAWASIVGTARRERYSPDDFLYVQILLGDIGNYDDINTWWRRQFPDPAEAPTRLTFQAGALPFGPKSSCVTAHWVVPRRKDPIVSLTAAFARHANGGGECAARGRVPANA
jgi:hypothetical protein